MQVGDYIQPTKHTINGKLNTNQTHYLLLDLVEENSHKIALLKPIAANGKNVMAWFICCHEWELEFYTKLH